MNLALEILNPMEASQLDKLLLFTKDYSFFHSTNWAKVIFETYGYKPFYFTLIRDYKIIVLIPLMEIKCFPLGRKVVSLPFSDYCESIIDEDIDYNDVFKALINFSKKCGWKYLEFRGTKFFPYSFQASSWFYGHSLDLTKNIDHIYKNFNNNTKRNIKKALEYGIEVIFCNSLDAMDDYYRLHCMTRKKHGIPPQSSFFFIKYTSM